MTPDKLEQVIADAGCREYEKQELGARVMFVARMGQVRFEFESVHEFLGGGTRVRVHDVGPRDGTYGAERSLVAIRGRVDTPDIVGAIISHMLATEVF